MISSDLKDLKNAKRILENPGFVTKVSDYIGSPIEKGIEIFPDSWKEKVGKLTQSTLITASHAAIFTLKNTPYKKSKTKLHKMVVATSGGIGGFIGLAGLPFELPISTTIIIRAIADVARSEGEDIEQIETKLACLEVLALGGPNKSEDVSKSGYFTVRSVLAKSIKKAGNYIAEKGTAKVMEKEGTPVIVSLIVRIAERFSIQVSEKIAAILIPVIGTVGGAIINTLFIGHFLDMARGHFIVRRLERKYGKWMVRNVYSYLI